VLACLGSTFSSSNFCIGVIAPALFVLRTFTFWEAREGEVGEETEEREGLGAGEEMGEGAREASAAGLGAVGLVVSVSSGSVVLAILF
jgi:hypothetical protein